MMRLLFEIFFIVCIHGKIITLFSVFLTYVIRIIFWDNYPQKYFFCFFLLFSRYDLFCAVDFISIGFDDPNWIIKVVWAFVDHYYFEISRLSDNQWNSNKNELSWTELKILIRFISLKFLDFLILIIWIWTKQSLWKTHN